MITKKLHFESTLEPESIKQFSESALDKVLFLSGSILKNCLLSILPICYVHSLLIMPSSLWIIAALSQTTLSPNNNTPRKPRRTNAVLSIRSVQFFHSPLFSTASTAKTNPKQRVLRNPPSRGHQVTTGDRGCREFCADGLSHSTRRKSSCGFIIHQTFSGVGSTCRALNMKRRK